MVFKTSKLVGKLASFNQGDFNANRGNKPVFYQSELFTKNSITKLIINLEKKPDEIQFQVGSIVTNHYSNHGSKKKVKSCVVIRIPCDDGKISH